MRTQLGWGCLCHRLARVDGLLLGYSPRPLHAWQPRVDGLGSRPSQASVLCRQVTATGPRASSPGGTRQPPSGSCVSRRSSSELEGSGGSCWWLLLLSSTVSRPGSWHRAAALIPELRPSEGQQEDAREPPPSHALCPGS